MNLRHSHLNLHVGLRPSSWAPAYITTLLVAEIRKGDLGIVFGASETT